MRRRILAVAAGLVIGCVAFGLLVLVPRVSFVITHGTSMAPRFHTGDLAVVLGQDRYRIGDIIAYHSTTLGTVILHRVVEIHGDHYVTKGDNNTWLDPDQPTGAQILGSLALHVPRGGRVLGLVGSPLVWLAALGAVLVAVATGSSVRKSARRKKPRMKPQPNPRRRWSTIALAGTGLAAVLAAMSVAGFLTGGSTTTRPAAHTVTWHYYAATPASTSYPSGQLGTDDPVFLRLVNRLVISATDSASGPLSASAFSASVSTTAGWSATVPVLPLGDNAIQVDLAALNNQLNEFVTETGIPVGLANVTITAAAADGWTPAMKFTDDTALLRVDPTTLTAQEPTDAAQPSALASIMDNLTSGLHRVRWLSALLALVTIGVALVWPRSAAGPAGTPGGRPRRGTTYATEVRIPADRVVVELASAAEVRRVARRVERPVIRYDAGDDQVVLVDDGDTVYRHATPAPSPAPVPATVPATTG